MNICFHFIQGISALEFTDDHKTIRYNEHIHSQYSYLLTHLSEQT